MLSLLIGDHPMRDYKPRKFSTAALPPDQYHRLPILCNLTKDTISKPLKN